MHLIYIIFFNLYNKIIILFSLFWQIREKRQMEVKEPHSKWYFNLYLNLICLVLEPVPSLHCGLVCAT